jgi:MFS family permease
VRIGLLRIGVWVFLVALISLPVQAMENGPLVADNILGGAAAGTLAGFSAGMLAYGLDHNYHSEYLINGAVYGFLGGALLGGGAATYEIIVDRPDPGFALSGYMAGGTSLGALIGIVAAVIPYTRDKTPEDFTIGLGLGGVIGAVLGTTVGFIDINSNAHNNSKALLSGKVGLIEMSSVLPSIIPEIPGEPMVNCRLVELTF